MDLGNWHIGQYDHWWLLLQNCNIPTYFLCYSQIISLAFTWRQKHIIYIYIYTTAKCPFFWHFCYYTSFAAGQFCHSCLFFCPWWLPSFQLCIIGFCFFFCPCLWFFSCFCLSVCLVLSPYSVFSPLQSGCAELLVASLRCHSVWRIAPASVNSESICLLSLITTIFLSLISSSLTQRKEGWIFLHTTLFSFLFVKNKNKIK